MIPDQIGFLLFDDLGTTLGEYSAIRDDDPMYMWSYDARAVYVVRPRRKMWVRSMRCAPLPKVRVSSLEWPTARPIDLDDAIYIGVMKSGELKLLGVRQAVVLHIDARGDMAG